MYIGNATKTLYIYIFFVVSKKNSAKGEIHTGLCLCVCLRFSHRCLCISILTYTYIYVYTYFFIRVFCCSKVKLGGEEIRTNICLFVSVYPYFDVCVWPNVCTYFSWTYIYFYLCWVVSNTNLGNNRLGWIYAYLSIDIHTSTSAYIHVYMYIYLCELISINTFVCRFEGEFGGRSNSYGPINVGW